MNQDPSSFAKDRVTPVSTPLDWPRLVAALSAYQASTRTARVAMGLEGHDRPASMPVDAFAEVIEGSRGWTAAAVAMAGRFHGELCVEPETACRPET